MCIRDRCRAAFGENLPNGSTWYIAALKEQGAGLQLLHAKSKSVSECHCRSDHAFLDSGSNCSQHLLQWLALKTHGNNKPSNQHCLCFTRQAVKTVQNRVPRTKRRLQEEDRARLIPPNLPVAGGGKWGTEWKVSKETGWMQRLWRKFL